MFNRRSTPARRALAGPEDAWDEGDRTGLFALGGGEMVPLPAMDVPLFMEMTPAAVLVVSLSGMIVDGNKAAAELYGLANRFELIGLPCERLLALREREAAARALQAVLEDGLIVNREFTCLRADGGTFEALVSARLVRGAAGEPAAFLVINQDISPRKAQELAVAESESKFRTLFESAYDGVFLVDGQARIVAVNRRGAALLGYPIERLVGVSAETFLAEGVQEDAISRHRALERGEDGPAVERMLRRADGTELPVEVQGTLVRDGAGRTFGVQYVVHDLSGRKRAEREEARVAGELRRALGSIINVVAATVEMRDPGTAGHQKRVANLARAIGAEMGLPAETIEAIRFAGVVHDVGKTSIPAEILSKPGRLSEDERRLVREHARFGFEILRNVEFPWPIAEIVRQHHERLDGSGYPRGLKGTEILIEARIIAVADVMEAMASHRPYRPSLGIEAALAEITAQRGVLYDERAVDACLKIFAERKVPLL